MSSDTAKTASIISFANKGSVYNVNLKYIRDVNEAGLRSNDSVLVVGQAKHLKAINLQTLESLTSQLEVPKEWLSESINYVSADVSASNNQGSNTASLSWLNKLVVYKVTDKASRHNAPSRSHAFVEVVRKNCFGENQLILVACERQSSVAIAAAIARSFPLYNGKSDEKLKRNVFVKFHFTDSPQEESAEELNGWNVLGESVRLAAKIVDTPCAQMNTDDFLEEIRCVGKELNIKPFVIDGEELNNQGFGGIYNVGKAAIHTPKLVVLSHLKPEAKRTLAWVGKGIVYDTGGLSLKTNAGMKGMKTDCGGAAAILGAFRTAVKLGFTDNLHAVFCLAENAIGPLALRPDDIIDMYSGKTVEISNTDAEGRLVLGDGVCYAKKDLKADIILDMATLTGAQGIATGKYHAGLLTNDEDWEDRIRVMSRSSGDLVFPLVFAPELHFSEFDSEFADMTNSCSKPNNAASSCAGLFIHSHLGSDFNGTWIHLDIAYPSTDKEHATGYGVSLLNTIFGDASENSLFKELRSKSN